jgi:hypothetical protein
MELSPAAVIEFRCSKAATALHRQIIGLQYFRKLPCIRSSHRDLHSSGKRR